MTKQYIEPQEALKWLGDWLSKPSELFKRSVDYLSNQLDKIKVGGNLQQIDPMIRAEMEKAGFAGVTPSPYPPPTQSTATTAPTIQLQKPTATTQSEQAQATKKPETKPTDKTAPTRPVKTATAKTDKMSLNLDTISQLIIETGIAEQAQIKPFQDAIVAKQEEFRQKAKEEKQVIKEYADNYEKIATEIEKVTAEPLPKPPTEKEVTTPQNAIVRTVKALTPIIVGITAILHPGKYGENMTYFNAMIDAIKKNDAEEYEKALRQWEINFQYTLQDKELKLKALQTKLNKVTKLGELKLKEIGIDKELLQFEINSNLEMIKAIKDIFKDSRDAFKAVADIQYKQQHLQIEREKASMLRQRLSSKSLEDLSPKELLKQGVNLLKGAIDPESQKLGKFLITEALKKNPSLYQELLRLQSGQPLQSGGQPTVSDIENSIQ